MKRFESNEASPFLADVTWQLHLGILAAVLLPHINIFLKISWWNLWKREDPFLFNGLHFMSLVLNPLSKFWFQETVQNSLTCVFSNASAHALGHILQAESPQKIKLTSQACQGVCFYYFPKGKREETWFWVTALHMHLVAYTRHTGSPVSSTKLYSLCILFSSPSVFQKEKILILLLELHRHNRYIQKGVSINSFACYIMNIRWILIC